MHPFGPRVWGRHDGESGPGLLSQVNGRVRVAGSCENASAPGTSLLRCRCFLQLGQDVETAGQRRRAIAVVAMWLPRRWASWA
jgi:hypothetical protein